jgi:hypothetical protein
MKPRKDHDMAALLSRSRSLRRTRLLQRPVSVLAVIALVAGMVIAAAIDAVNPALASSRFAEERVFIEFQFDATKVTTAEAVILGVTRQAPSPTRDIQYEVVGGGGPVLQAAEPAPVGMEPSPRSGDGSSSDPYLYEILFDCAVVRDLGGSDLTRVELEVGQAGKYYRIEMTNCLSGASGIAGLASIFDARAAVGGNQGVEVQYYTPSRSTTTSTQSPTDDPTAAAVATAVEQSIAGGVAGTSSAVLIRADGVVPLTSSLSASAGPRGGVVLQAEGLKVTVASEVGARAQSGVIVPTGGEVQCVLCGDFVPGSVVEAWLYSDPRLTAAVSIPEGAQDGDCHLLAIPTSAPLDGGGPVESGAHTLQLRMYTDDGFTVLSTGITIGSVTPTSIPAGEGSVPLSGPLGGVLLLGAAGLGLAAVRRQVVTG